MEKKKVLNLLVVVGTVWLAATGGPEGSLERPERGWSGALEPAGVTSPSQPSQRQLSGVCIFPAFPTGSVVHTDTCVLSCSRALRVSGLDVRCC